MLEDKLFSFCADAEVGSRVTANTSNEALREMRLLIREPPCFPVAPVINKADIIVVLMCTIK